MSRPPRRAKEPVVSPTALIQVILASLIIGGATLITFGLERNYGSTLVTSQTTSVTMLAVGQTAYLFNCRFLHRSSFTRRAFTGNRVVWIAIGCLFLLQLIFVYAPFMHDWFDSAPIGLREWGVTLALGVGVFVLAEVSKVLSRAIAARLTASGRRPSRPV
jgi:magnesium-transporting ATPase (P-type)